MDGTTRKEREQAARRESILERAEQLICARGLEHVSMDELARETEFTKKSLYRYFTCKEDLAFAVALRGYRRLYDGIHNRLAPDASGYERVRMCYAAFYDFFREYPRLAQLISMTGQAKAGAQDTEMPYRREFMEFDRLLFEEILVLFREGRADGSIRADVDTAYLAFSSVFVAVGFFQLLSQSGATYTAHFGLDADRFARFTIDRLIEGIRS